MGAEDLKIDAQSVKLIQDGVRGAIAELGEIGASGTGKNFGKGFSELAMTGMDAGHHGLATTFEDFAERWEWGVRALILDANVICMKLGIAAGVLWEEEQYIEGTFKIVVNAAIGNPHASEEDVVKQDWGDTFTPDYLSPDYSAESFRRAGDDIGQAWKDTGRALVTEGNGGRQAEMMNDLLGVDQEAFDRAVDDVYGPSPEERVQQQGGE
ncbi:hypothetical protein SRB5_06870 [Streptomyces sp. RB5]|uniref:Uncharacterized protein n=1 Tax=Streptomyces smaragdinus TaxID=2585196 RepID=A0A7K0CB00_9ACTN|nr:hypothetical protein [Streptomyces smaragdinus]MQY10576.1 hypothetical protein [Streptomyces smaragdinus]